MGHPVAKYEGKAQLQAIRSGCEPPPFELLSQKMKIETCVAKIRDLSVALARPSKTQKV
jgi:hypothetical protein